MGMIYLKYILTNSLVWIRNISCVCSTDRKRFTPVECKHLAEGHWMVNGEHLNFAGHLPIRTCIPIDRNRICLKSINFEWTFQRETIGRIHTRHQRILSAKKHVYFIIGDLGIVDLYGNMETYDLRQKLQIYGRARQPYD